MTRFFVSTDPRLIDVVAAHVFLSQVAYWSKGIPLDVVRRSIENSMVFGVYDSETPRPRAGADSPELPSQVGMARVITDKATFAYIADVFILESCRSQGLSKRLMEAIGAHPELQHLRRWMLITADAHGLYRQFGFKESTQPERVMERVDRDVYKRMS